MEPNTKPRRLVLAFDPGNHTGIAWSHADGTYDTTMIHENLPLVYTYLTLHPPEACVIEGFYTSGNIDRHGLYTVRLVGALIALAHHLHVPCVEHSPQARYPYLEKARLYLHKTRLTHRYTQHDVDSLAHVFTYEDRMNNPNYDGEYHNVESTTASRNVHARSSSGRISTPKAVLDRLRQSETMREVD